MFYKGGKDMDKITDIIGSHTYEIVEFSNGWILALPDINYIVKAILLIVCAAFFLKGMFSLIRSF